MTAKETEPHHVEIHHEGPTKSGEFRFGGGHRARCSCGWGSDCYSQLSDTQRAIEVHLRRAQSKSFNDILARSSIGVAIADIRKRGIERTWPIWSAR